MSKSVLEDLYEGDNANFINLKITQEYEKAREDYDGIYNNFLNGLTDEQKKAFDNLYVKIILAESIVASQHFKEGFKLGLKIGAEVFKD